MQSLLVIILVCVLAGTLVAFCVFGLKNWRRLQRLTSLAYENKLNYSSIDIFNIPLRYNNFALMQIGHLPRAYNISYGNINGMPIKGFDFNYEAAHGPRREVRFYNVVIIETPYLLKPAILWNKTDIDNGPIETRHGEMFNNKWVCLEDRETAENLCNIMIDLEISYLTVEIQENTILLTFPCIEKNSSYFDILQIIPQIIDKMHSIYPIS